MRVAFILVRMTMSTELDADAIGTKPVDQIGQRPFGRSRTAGGKRPPYLTLAAASQDMPVASGRLGEHVKVVARLAFPILWCAAGQMRGRHLTRQPPIPLLATSQYQQMYRILGIALPPKR
ncbi:Uncharacterised protein [Mycobacteroides abscessus subsp. abscessus]|nr:Uncharacterised protein [Mycobacteroides abscessus subsp. abscessus]